MSLPKTLWSPRESFKKASNMNAYKVWLSKNQNIDFDNYQQLWNWSIKHQNEFWESILNYFQVDYSGEYNAVNTASKNMYETRWFEGIEVSYAEHIFKNISKEKAAIVFKSEHQRFEKITWDSLHSQTAKIANYLKSCGVKKGDRVCSMLPNSPEAIIAFLATNSIGAVWTSCSPDFGIKSILDRFTQIEPKVFITTNAYQYNGKIFSKIDEVKEIASAIPSITNVLMVDYIEGIETDYQPDSWKKVLSGEDIDLYFERVDFNHPIWILYSSGTTGKPKAITHSVGGILIEHFKALALHQNVKPGDTFFWYSTTGWMMWNYAVSALLVKGTVAIYDGSPAFPNAYALWDFAEEAEINHFGAGASYYLYCMKEGMDFTKNEYIKNIESFGSTGSPLPPEGFDWFNKKVNPNAWIISLSGGTDICSGFVGGNPFEPVYEGEIQCRMLGVNLKSYSEEGNPIVNELGEMVIENAMPSMPIYFWNDKNNKRYKSSYFDMYPGKWRHGDWIKITERNTLIIYGRSDATLNRGGVRIGTSEIYSATESVEEVADSLIVCIDQENGSQTMPMFVQLKEGFELDMKLKQKIKKKIKTQYSSRHIPDKIFQVSEIPYTISGKKMEAPVKKILSGIAIEKAASIDAMKNPKALEFFKTFKFKE
ncbi:MAG: acetoacetate--CoA ligase [Flavobacteriales bacterium]|nr:acetoacetate--CoA ligase [Flavobacteriales bacterium]